MLATVLCDHVSITFAAAVFQSPLRQHVCSLVLATVLFDHVSITLQQAIATICLLGPNRIVPDNEYEKLDGSGGRDGDDEGEEELQDLMAISIRSSGRGQDGELKNLGEVTRAILDELAVLATASRAAA